MTKAKHEERKEKEVPCSDTGNWNDDEETQTKKRKMSMAGKYDAEMMTMQCNALLNEVRESRKRGGNGNR